MPTCNWGVKKGFSGVYMAKQVQTNIVITLSWANEAYNEALEYQITIIQT